MKTEFIIQKGSLSFMDNYIEINDISKWAKRLKVISPIIWTLYGIMSVLRYFKTGDQFLLWSGLFFIIAWIIVGFINLKKNYDKKLSFDIIDKVIIKKDLFDRLVADFIIRNSVKKRSVLIDFDKYSLKDFELALKDKNIKTEIEY